MFFLYDMFSDENSVSSSGNQILVSVVKIANGIFDHLNLLDKIDISTNVFDKTIPTEWTNNTLMDANFNGTTNAGNINNIIANVDHLDIQRREDGSSEWITLQQIFKDYTTDTIKTNFIMQDTYERNGVVYYYRIVPVDKNGDVGYAIQQDVLSIFNDAYIADANHIYKITYEYTKTNQMNQVSTIYTPYGSKYPYVAYNAETQYNSGNITAVLLAPTSNSKTSSYIDRKAQAKLVDEFNAWLANGKAKILKDFNGDLKIGTVTDAIPNSYYKELGNGLASTSFNFVETGEFTQKYIDNLGLKNKFNLKYND